MSIKVLPPKIANQIAARELIYRPASVVKELIENSLDAGATKIKINIERGGIKCINILDNGSGIAKDELSIAMKRYSTSKIKNIKDIENINSMGFRGEALNSISSVSRFKIISRTNSQKEAWQLYLEENELIILKPAAHPIGTTIEVLDLFYNMPSRRKLMHTEKTEFIYINEIIRIFAIKRFDVTFILKHNNKLISQYLAVINQHKYCSRMIKLCSSVFVEKSIEICFKNSNITIKGWISNPQICKKINMQYIYVNNRIINSKLIKYAVLQAYQEKFEIQPCFILFIEINPNQIDINLSPNKNKLIFYKNRLIHYFIYNAVVNCLQQDNLTLIKNNKNYRKSYFYNYADNNKLSYFSNKTVMFPQELEKKDGNIFKHKLQLGDGIYSFGRLLTLIIPSYVLIELKNSIELLSLSVLNLLLIEYKLINGIIDDTLISYSLIMPFMIDLCKKEIIVLKYYQPFLKKIGFLLKIDINKATLYTVPLLFKNIFKNIIPNLLSFLNNRITVTHKKIIGWIVSNLSNQSVAWNYYQAMHLLTDIDLIWPKLITKTPSKIRVKLQLKFTIQELNELLNDK